MGLFVNKTEFERGTQDQSGRRDNRTTLQKAVQELKERLVWA